MTWEWDLQSVTRCMTSHHGLEALPAPGLWHLAGRLPGLCPRLSSPTSGSVVPMSSATSPAALPPPHRDSGPQEPWLCSRPLAAIHGVLCPHPGHGAAGPTKALSVCASPLVVLTIFMYPWSRAASPSYLNKLVSVGYWLVTLPLNPVICCLGNSTPKRPWPHSSVPPKPFEHQLQKGQLPSPCPPIWSHHHLAAGQLPPPPLPQTAPGQRGHSGPESI